MSVATTWTSGKNPLYLNGDMLALEKKKTPLYCAKSLSGPVHAVPLYCLLHHLPWSLNFSKLLLVQTAMRIPLFTAVDKDMTNHILQCLQFISLPFNLYDVEDSRTQALQ